MIFCAKPQNDTLYFQKIRKGDGMKNELTKYKKKLLKILNMLMNMEMNIGKLEN